MVWLGRFSEIAYALLRFMAGVMFLLHGTQKFFGFPPGAPGGGGGVKLASLPGLAGVIEIVAGTLIAIGLFTSIAAFIASGEMAVAYFMAHAPKSFWPLANEGEVPVLYCFLFLYLATRGDGRYSVGGMFRRGPRPAL